MRRKFLKMDEMHPRDYSVVSCTALFEKFVSRAGKIFFGRPFYEIVTVIKQGQYYYGVALGDRTETPKAFLQKINKDQINLKKIYRRFEIQVKGYQTLLKLPKSKLRLDSIKGFFQYYHDLIDVAYAAMDTLDVAYVLKPQKRKYFEKWAIRARRTAENLYKEGETVFVPKFLSWFRDNYAKTYTPKLLSYLFYHELLDFIDGKAKLPSLAELKQRNNWFYVSQYPWSKYELASGKKAFSIIKRRRLFETKIPKLTELKGQTAYPGQAQGRVSLILTKKQLGKYKRGNIIVAPMTDPYYLPIMKQAPAFVTDEGGILSHAAIVAREMKKPCVVGTKFATKIFKDGDLVEVDAVKGIVRKIN